MTGFFEQTDGTQAPVPHDLDQHEDVVLTTPADTELLTFNSTEGQWENKPNVIPPNSFLNEIGDVNAPTPNDTEGLTWSDSMQQWVSAAFTSNATIALEGLTNVSIAGLLNGDRLAYNSGSLMWENIPGSGNNLIVGDGTEESTITLDCVSTEDSKIIFKSDSVTTWEVINPKADKAQWSIGNGDAALLFAPALLAWNKDFFVVDSNISCGLGNVQGATMTSGSFLELADGVAEDVGVFWGPGGSATTNVKINTPGSLEMNHTGQIDLVGQGGSVLVSLQPTRVLFQVPSASLGGGISTMQLTDTAVRSLGGFDTDFNFEVTGASGHMICPNDATQDDHLPNWKQVKDWVDLNYVSK
jgi:hypothetical protein